MSLLLLFKDRHHGDAGGAKTDKRYSPLHGRRHTSISDDFVDRIRTLSLDKKPKKRRKRAYIPEPKAAKQGPAKFREVLPFSLERFEPDLGFGLDALFAPEGEKEAFEYLDAYKHDILAQEARIEALEAENAKRQLVARLRRQEQQDREEWQRVKDQIERVLILKLARKKEEDEFLLLLGLDEDETVFLIN